MEKKCRVCSRLSSWLDRIARLFFGSRSDCPTLFARCDALANERVAAIASAAPECICEGQRVSKHSPSPVAGREVLTRFIFSPMHLDRKGKKVKPSLFEQVHSSGCSVQRDSLASDAELISFVDSFLALDPARQWMGSLEASCDSIRSIFVDGISTRTLCVFDTGELENNAHAELFSATIFDEADRSELRYELWKIFNSKALVFPEAFRAGRVFRGLSVAYQKPSSPDLSVPSLSAIAK